MAEDDFKLTFRSIMDESLVDQDGKVVKSKRVDFRLGKYGPFTERIPLDVDFETELRTRVTKLRTQLENLHR